MNDRFVAAIFAIGFLVSNAVLGAFPEDQDSLDFEQLKRQIENNSAEAAATTLQQALADDPSNPDLLNLLGYANRRLGRWEQSREFYSRALALDPRHKGALEYMGELELELDNVDAATILLRQLEKECPAGCDELSDLLLAFSKRGVLAAD